MGVDYDVCSIIYQYGMVQWRNDYCSNQHYINIIKNYWLQKQLIHTFDDADGSMNTIYDESAMVY